MADQGDASVEVMIWLNHPGLSVQSDDPRYYPVRLDGHRWHLITGLASDGHGRSGRHPRGWSVVNFIAPDDRNGDVLVTGLHLNALIGYAIRQGWLPRNDWLLAIDSGGEMTQGTFSLTGYNLTGVR